MIVINDYDVGAIFQEIEIELIKSMRRNLARHDAWEVEEGFKWEQWQAKKIREIRKYRKENQSIMASYSKKLDNATKADLRKQFLEGGRKVDKEVSRVIQKGYSLVRGTPSNDFFQGNNDKLDRLVNAINKDFKEAQHAALRQMDDVYRKTIFKSEVYLGSGATTIDKAIDMATDDFLTKGINCITYANGRKVNIASYSQMAVRTANKRVFLMGEGERRKEWGLSVVLVSQYMKCSPLCLPWQGKVYIDDVYSGGKQEDGPYPLLSEAIKGNLFHPNCRHTMSTFFEGINEEPELMNKDEIGKAYEKTKRDNEINRNIQKYKRLREGSLDPKNIIKYDNKLKEWQNKLKGIDNTVDNAIIKNKRDGSDRANDYKEFWTKASLIEQIDKYLKNPIATGVNSKGKIIYSSGETAIRIIYDVNGDYFRLQDMNMQGKKNYLDINGIPAFNIIENGKARGRTKPEFQAATHFKNTERK